MQITAEQFNELLLAGLRQIASDAERLSGGNIAHRAAQIRANALQLLEITKEVSEQNKTTSDNGL
jgi:hypothetical protein